MYMCITHCINDVVYIVFTIMQQAPIAIPPYQALNVITEDGDKDVFLNTAARSSTSSELTMQMFYQPPFNEGGPASNYSSKENVCV